MARLSVSTPGAARARHPPEGQPARVCSPVCWVSADNWEQVMCKLGTGGPSTAWRGRAAGWARSSADPVTGVMIRPFDQVGN